MQELSEGNRHEDPALKFHRTTLQPVLLNDASDTSTRVTRKRYVDLGVQSATPKPPRLLFP